MSGQVWAAPVPPGPEVTHVRDRHGVVWRRDDDLFWADLGGGYEQHRTWWELLARGPLTNATGEVA